MVAFDEVKNSADIRNHILDLIQKKSKRDNIEYTIRSLGRDINKCHSILYRYLTEDLSQQNKYLRVEILKKIADHFKSDGFDTSLERFLNSDKIYIEGVNTVKTCIVNNIPMYNNKNTNELIETIQTEINLKYINHNFIAFKFDEYVPPIFHGGSIWFVDCDLEPVNNSICAIEYQNKLILRKYFITKKDILLFDLNESSGVSEKYNVKYNILGTAVKATMLK